MRRIAVFLGIAAFAPWACAQPGNVKRLDGSTIAGSEIDATVSRLMKAGEVTGAGITIFTGGKVAYSKACGYRDVEKKLPLTEDSVLGAASFTKVAFTYLAMQLVQDGAIDLDKTVQQQLPNPLPSYASYADLAGRSALSEDHPADAVEPYLRFSESSVPESERQAKH